MRDVEELKMLPSRVSMRKGALRNFGGDLVDLYDSHRFDSYVRSRDAGHCAHKDHTEHKVTRNKLVRRQVRYLFGKD
jgi:hypothetical protein